jgi:hypothetical protein
MKPVNPRRSFLRGAGAALALAAIPAARAQHAAVFPDVTVYKSPSCGCCGGWVDHMRENGFRVEVRSMDDVSPAKARYGVPEALWSCHTALVGGYAIEGHVPAGDLKRLLRERPKVKGLAVPGMVSGSPGMSGPRQAFDVVAFDDRGTRVFASH